MYCWSDINKMNLYYHVMKKNEFTESEASRLSGRGAM